MSQFTDPRRIDTLDARGLACEQRFKTIMERWNGLKPGEAFILINSQDPLPLYFQLSTQFRGELDWRYEKRGPDVYEIFIGRLSVETPE